MMAFDRTPSNATLAPATIESLRTLLGRSVREGNHVDALRDVLTVAAVEAKDKGIQAEQLLVILKDVWYTLPELADVRQTARESALLQDLISRCIQQYYAV